MEANAPSAVAVPVRVATTEVWASTRLVLQPGELGVDILTGTRRFGDGTSLWAALPVVSGGGDTSALLSKSGGTMTGPLVLAGDPTTPLQAATRQYVLARIADLTAGTPAELDTFLEAYNRFLTDESALSSLTTALAGKADAASTTTALAGKASTLSRTPVKTAAYTAVASNLVPVDTTAGAVTITLPTAPTDKTQVAVKQVLGTAGVTVNTAGSDTFNRTGGATTMTLTLLTAGALYQYDAATSVWTVGEYSPSLTQLDSRFGPVGLQAVRGLVPAAATNVIGNFASNGSDAAASYRTFLPFSDPTVVEVLPAFTNQPNLNVITGDRRAPNDIIIAAAVELPDGSVLPFTFNGQHTVTIPRGGGLAIPDHPLNFGAQVTDTTWPGRTGVWVRTYVTGPAPRTDTATVTSGSSVVADATITAADQGRAISGTGIPTIAYVGTVTPGTSFVISSSSDTSTAVNATANGTSVNLRTLWPLNGDTVCNPTVVVGSDLTLEGSTAGKAGFGGTNANPYGPALLLAPAPKTRKPLWGSLTDSIFAGTSDKNAGPVTRAAVALSLPHVKMSKVGESALGLVTPLGRKYRAHLLPGLTHGIIELGTNDGVDTLTKATALQASLTTLLTYLNTLGGKWWVTTVPPKGTSSTDGYATTAGQTPYNTAAGLAQINTWIRGGCGGLAAGFIEMGDVLSSARDSGLWASHPTRGRRLTDVSTTAGSNVVTSPTGAFTSADVGLSFFVTGVYTSFTQTITSVTDAQTVVMSSNAGSTVSGVVGGVGAWYATQDGTHPSNAMMLGGILTNVTAVMAAAT